MFWSVDGSGGESHFWTQSRSWFSKMMDKAPQPGLTRLGDDERSTRFMTCFVSLPSDQFRVKHISGSSEDNLHTTSDLGDLVVDVAHSIKHPFRISPHPLV